MILISKLSSVVPLSFIICKALLLNCTWLCTMYLIWVNETVWIEETSTITIYIGRHKIFADLCFLSLLLCCSCLCVCLYVCMCFDELLNHNIMCWFYGYNDNIKRYIAVRIKASPLISRVYYLHHSYLSINIQLKLYLRHPLNFQTEIKKIK